jgi:hypothetical protein
MTFAHNVFMNIGPENGKLFQINNVPDLTLDHNTGVAVHSALYLVGGMNPRLTVTGNIFGLTQYGLFSVGGGGGTSALEKRSEDWVFEDNVLARRDNRPYPARNHYPASNAEIGFANLDRGDLRLRAPRRWATRGMPPGADIDAVAYAIDGVVVHPR